MQVRYSPSDGWDAPTTCDICDVDLAKTGGFLVTTPKEELHPSFDGVLALCLDCGAEDGFVRCPKCRYTWQTKSKRLWVTCPNCQRKFKRGVKLPQR